MSQQTDLSQKVFPEKFSRPKFCCDPNIFVKRISDMVPDWSLTVSVSIHMFVGSKMLKS
jgi:hypothetical protein